MVGNVLKHHNGSPILLFDLSYNGNAGTQRKYSILLNEFFEDDQSVVKDYGKTDFVETSKKRSRRMHRSFHKRTEPISTELSQDNELMVTSDIGLQNVKYSFLERKNE